MEARPYNMEYILQRQAPVEQDSSDEVIRQDHVQDRAIEQYKHDLTIIRRICLYYRVIGRSFKHTANKCRHRWDWIRVKKDVLEELKGRGREWISQYVACWKCFQP